VARLVNGIEDSEFSLSGHIVADIALAEELERGEDGSVTLAIEALTVQS
jgi:hypothetical protein